MITQSANRFWVIQSVGIPRPTLVCVFLLFLGWVALFGPVYAGFAETVWRRDENAHAPFLLAICVGLIANELYRRRFPKASRGEIALGVVFLSLALWAFVFARATQFTLLMSALQGFIAAALVIVFFGRRGLKALWVPLTLRLYLVIWPGWLLDSATLPLKLHISQIVAETLYAFGLPTAYEGALITVGQYKLLVADACSGVNSMIALTSIGVVYIFAASQLTNFSRPRLANIVLAISLIPIAYCANVLRVMVLVLLTHFFGHDIGQGFLHDLAGLFLFGAALALVFIVDGLILAVSVKTARKDMNKYA